MSTLSTKRAERRQSPRTAAEKLAYIRLESDNGGIVLNVSDEGLGFHAMGPILQNGTIHFSFSLPANPRIEAAGEVVWTDDTKKTCGLRLLLPAGDREQFRNWVAQSVIPRTVNGEAASRMRPRIAPVPEAPSPKIAAPAVLVRPVQMSKPAAANWNPDVKAARRHFHPKFIGGFVLGLLISGFAVTMVPVIVHRFRAGRPSVEPGQAIERTAPPQAAVPPPAPALVPGTPVPPANDATTSEGESLKQLAAEIAALEKGPESAAPARHKKPPASPSATQGNSGQAPPEPAAQSSAPVAAGAPAPENTAPTLETAPQVEASKAEVQHAEEQDAEEQGGAANPAKYLDAGSFKDLLRANEATDAITQLGFHASIVHKGHLWMSSYHVLVGPFARDEQANTARATLESRGFAARLTKTNTDEAR